MKPLLNVDPQPIARELQLRPEQVQRTLELLDDGNTIPFITRYRKDETGGLDEEQIRRIAQAASRWRALQDRRTTILKSIQAQGRLTPALEEAIRAADSLKRLEDLYLPYKPRKQTLATLARRRGLEPLARAIWEATGPSPPVEELAAAYVCPEKGLPTVADVLQGVRHLLAEWWNESVELRDSLRRFLWQKAYLVSCRAESPKVPAREQPSQTMLFDLEPRGTEPGADATGAGVQADVATTPLGEVPAGDIGSHPTSAGSAHVSSEPSAVFWQRELDFRPADEPSESLVPTPSGASPAATQAVDRASLASDPSQWQSSPPPNFASPAPSSAAISGTGRLTAAERRRQQRARLKEAKKRRLQAAFKDYFDFREAIAGIPPHRVLAINRGERARILKVKVEIDPAAAYQVGEQVAVKPGHPYAELLGAALRDALQRLILPSLERELRRELTERAEQHAVQVFARNLRKLLLQPPVRGHRIVAIDPGLRSGCRMVALDEFGNVLGHDSIRIIGPAEQRQEGRRKLAQLVRTHQASIIAIGNGEGCREAEQFVADTLAEELSGLDVSYVIVNEAGTSVYSTSSLGREELPQYDPTTRSAISIGRRLLDPLSELVKVNPANLGVGLYQHDIKAKHLQASLDQVVESCVNFVGVDVNTASPALLRYVSGLNQLTARRVYEYRLQHGPFRSREELKNVPGLGEASYVQAAGFLRVHNGVNPLDATWIHPESYRVALRVLERLGASLDWLKAPGSAGAKDDSNGTTAAHPERESPPGLPQSLQQGDGNPSELVLACAAATSWQPGAGTMATTQPRVAGAATTTAACPPQGEPSAPLPQQAQQGDVTCQPDVSDRAVQNLPAAIHADGGSRAAEATDTSIGRSAVEPCLHPQGPVAASTSSVSHQEAVSEKASTGEPTDSDAPDCRFDRRALLAARIAQVDVSQLAQELGVGELLLKDIFQAFISLGRDPREDLPLPIFRRGIMKLDDLKPGMELTGTVYNVVDFGAFVDIGSADCGLVHISCLANRFINDPHEVVGVGDVLRVWVLDVDRNRRRVSLTAIPPGTQRQLRTHKRSKSSRTDGRDRRKRVVTSGTTTPSGEGSLDASPTGTAVSSRVDTAPTDKQGQPMEANVCQKTPCADHVPPAAAVHPPTTSGSKETRPPSRRKKLTWTSAPSVPAAPLTKAVEEGREPMRSFAELLQFYQSKHQSKHGAKYRGNTGEGSKP